MTQLFIFPFALAAMLAAPPGAAQHAHDHAAPAANSIATAGKSVLAEGEVRKVDRAKGIVTIKHGPLEKLGMGPMTMPFTAADPKLLAGVKEGDKVRFEPGQTSDGKLTVSRIEVVK
jgi:Cu(I)/Ag(I) efflux system protein CusF